MSSDEQKTRVKRDQTRLKRDGVHGLHGASKCPADDTAGAKTVMLSKTPGAAQKDPLVDSLANDKAAVTSPVGETLSFELTEPRSANTAGSLEAGALIKQRFLLEKRIGRGGMGTIFLAKDLRKDELKDSEPYVAIKFLNEELSTNLNAIMALQREAKKTQKLSHANIVTVYDFDRENTIFFFSMEYLRGESLDKYIGRSENLREKQSTLIRYIEHMARGLAFAHQRGFVHADFKPANVFLTADNEIKILDLGIAQAVRSNFSQKDAQDTFFDVNAMGALTPNYASLEMLQYERPIPADDVYALACVAYELLSGAHPYEVDGKRHTAEEAQQQSLEVKSIAGVPRPLMRAIKKGLNFNRQDRFVNAVQFIDVINPRVKLTQSAIATISILAITALISWGVTVNQSEVVIGLNDLPESMHALAGTLKQGDQLFDEGDIDHAHKLYVQAWEAGFESVREDSRDHYKLKVLIDRRVDKIIDNLIVRSENPQLDTFSLMQLQVTLEFLMEDDLGTLDEKIASTLAEIKQRLASNK